MLDRGFVADSLTVALIAAPLYIVSTIVYARRYSTATARPADRGWGWCVRATVRVVLGHQPPLGRGWRHAEVVVREGAMRLRVSRAGLGSGQHPEVMVEVRSLDRSAVRRAGWRHHLALPLGHELVVVTTATGAQVQLALHARDLEVLIDALEGRPPTVPAEPAPVPPRTLTFEARASATTPKAPAVAAHLMDQLEACLGEVEAAMGEQGMSWSDVERVSIRSIDVHAVTRGLGVLASRYAAAGVTPSTTVVGADPAEEGDPQVEVEVTAVR